MNARPNDVLVVALITILAAIAAMALPSAALRTIAGLALVCYLPGYAILRALNGDRRSDLTGFVFATGLSVVATILCGLLLNLVGPLTPVRWTLALGAVTLVACGVASARDRNRPAVARAPVRLPALRAGQIAMLACSVAIVAATIAWARQELLGHAQFAYTELWMMPEGRGGAITIGIRNVERSSSAYDLEVVLDSEIVAVRRSIALRPGESWISDFAIPMPDDETHTAEARLFRRGNDRVVYRRAWLKTGSREQ